MQCTVNGLFYFSEEEVTAARDLHVRDISLTGSKLSKGCVLHDVCFIEMFASHV